MSLLFFYDKLKNNHILDKLFIDYEIVDDGFVEFKNKNLKLYGKVVKINSEINEIAEIINKIQPINKMENILVYNIYKRIKYNCFIFL
jgi:hypothetical protein